MLQIFIILCAVITFTLMAADPRKVSQDQTISAWQEITQTAEVETQKHLNLDTV